MTMEEARQLAKATVGRVANGGEPAATPEHGTNAPTVTALGVDYLDDVTARRMATTAIEYKRLWEKHVTPAMDTTQVSDVTSVEVARLHRSLRSTPLQSQSRSLPPGIVFRLREAPRRSREAHASSR